MLRLFRTLVLRPLRRDLLRTLLTVIAVALGVAIVIAIELAGDAAAGSFQSSMTTVVGKTDLEILANGGIDESWIGRLSALPINARFAPGLNATVRVTSNGYASVGYVTLYGIDVVSEAQGQSDTKRAACDNAAPAFVTNRLSRAPATSLPDQRPLVLHCQHDRLAAIRLHRRRYCRRATGARPLRQT